MPRPSQRQNRLPALRGLSSFLGLTALLAVPLTAVTPPGDSPVAAKAFRHPDLQFRNVYRAPAELPEAEAARADRDLAALGVAKDAARLDPRSGRWGTLLPAQPLLPGTGVGNSLSWDTLKIARPVDPAQLEGAALEAFTDYLATHRAALGIELGELEDSRATASPDGAVIQIHGRRAVDGVPVRDSTLSATINHGNLVLFGTRNWGTVQVATSPTLELDEASTRAEAFLKPLASSGVWDKPELLLVPLARGHELGEIAIGQGLTFRLAWALRPAFAADDGTEYEGRWEILVDAHSGEILAFEDRSHYATRRVAGGVYPLSNDGILPDGVEQAGWPMPFDSVLNAGSTLDTDAGGNLPLCAVGDVTSNLSGQFVRINDSCGAISLTGPGDLDFGTSAGTDCTTPGFGGAGNTHASRTNFYELNRIHEQARGQLPGNTWLQSRLTSNVNLGINCNASWNGTSVNFFCSNPGVCANSGELAGIIDHEWGHGLDDNDANGSISSPGEGIADVYAYLRTDTSCIGRGFRLGVNCSGYGDPCTACDGVRDIDFANRASGQPHDIVWINANCGSSGSGPCGGSVHCEGAVYAEAIYDLVNRDLPALFGMDHNTALEVGTRLTYLGAGAVGAWFQCTSPFGGCNADGGYLNFLAADDDNGNINDGTPHMSAIFAAFDRHGIACNSPAVVDSGCAGTPAAAPVVAASPLDSGASLSWGAVAGATEYHIFRTDGVSACDQGKVKVGETAGTSFVDTGLQNGRNYSYIVIPIGAADTCMGPASSCTSVTPVAGPNLTIDEESEVFSILSVSDGDAFLDNCELARFTFDVDNTGIGGLTNVRLSNATSPSHPGFTFVTAFPSPLTPANLPECDSASGSVDFIAGGLAPGDVVEIQIEVTADELASPRTTSFFITLTEGDFQAFASRTFSYETDFEGWQVVSGTFTRDFEGGGANGTLFHLSSSDLQPNQCDQIRSPFIRLSPTSTLELDTSFAIEGFGPSCGLCSPAFFDRANVGLLEVATGARSLLVPDGGRPYNAGGPNGTCGTTGQDGWAGTAINFGPSTWSPAALAAAAPVGEIVQLDIRYGTDGAVQGSGFDFDEVILTDVEVLAADTSGDVCVPECAVDADCDDALFCNGAETCLAGVCIVGPLPCDDGVSCTVDTCDEGADSCASAPSDALCDNGLFCDGAETCDPALDCQVGTPVDCNDGVGCTDDACNETLDLCDNLPNATLCQNGLFCDGPEVCDPALDCQPGTPVDCSDGVGCTVDICNEAADLCESTADDTLCDNGLFCDGAEFCDAVLDCQIGPDPCIPFACDDGIDECVGTPVAQLEAGTVQVSDEPVTVNLTHPYLRPVIVASMKYQNNVKPTITRISNVFPTRFDVVLQNPAGGPAAFDTVSYLVVESGSWTIDGVPVDAQRYLSSLTDEDGSWVGEMQSYGQAFTAPVVLGQVMSTNDPLWSVFWTRGPTRFDPPDAVDIFAGKTVCEDPNIVRADELVGFVAVETGHGTINGVEYDTRVGPDSVQGVGNFPPYFYNFLEAFPVVPTVGLVTQAGVDDNNGCWAQIHGSTGMSAVNIFLSIDEDRIGDLERGHSTEQVGYWAFATPVVFPPVPLTDPDGDGLPSNVDPCLGADGSGDFDLDGVCADSDCDDTDASIAMFDSCGVCGGDNTTCGGNENVGDPATITLWHLNDDGSDSGGNGNDLAVLNDRVSFVAGQFGLAAEMGVDPWEGDCLNSDGGALTAPGTGASYPGSGDWTVEAWVKVADYAPGYTVVSHYTQFWDGHEPYELRLDPGGQLVFAITDRANQTVAVSAPLSSPAGQWTHVAGVYREGQSLEIYENFEILAIQATDLVPETLTSYDVYVGGTFCGTSTGLYVDDVRVSNFARYVGCLADSDGDGVCDALDACPDFDDSIDADNDAIPDGCDACFGDNTTGDADLDGFCDNLDVCFGDDLTGDSDLDGFCDDVDACADFDDNLDADNDTVPDACDVCPNYDDTADADNDGVPDGCDLCAGSDDALDADLDGVPDGCDLCAGSDDALDADLDGVPDGCDLCLGDDASGDGDNDGTCADTDCDDGNPDAATLDGCGVCGGDNATCGVFFDGFESGDLSGWS